MVQANRGDVLKNGDIVVAQRAYVGIAEIGDFGVVVDAPPSMRCDKETLVLVTQCGYIILAAQDVTPTGKILGGASFDSCNSARMSGALGQALIDGKLQGKVESAMTTTNDLTWIGDAERAVAFGPTGLKMAIRTGNEVVTFAEVQKRLQDGEMGDDLPCVMEGFGVDYDAACDAVFGRQFQEAISLLNQACQEHPEAEKDDSPSPGM